MLCNTGSNNRVGPGRLYVGLARHWASLGFTVVRVDLGGAGDSLDVDPATENQPLAPNRIDELRDIVAWVRRSTGFEHVAVSGMCSGAFNAFHVAINGMHIDQLMLVNPGIFYLGAGETVLTSDEIALHSAYALTQGVISGRKWKGAMRDREILRRGLKSVRFLFQRSAVSGFRVMVAGSIRNAARSIGLPVRAPSALAQDLEDLIGRGMKVLIVFAAEERSARYLRTFGGAACEALMDRRPLRSNRDRRRGSQLFTTRFAPALDRGNDELSRARISGAAGPIAGIPTRLPRPGEELTELYENRMSPTRTG